MRYSRLCGSIVSELREDFKRLRWTLKDCPFHVHVSLHSGSGSGSEAYMSVCFSTSEHSPYMHDSSVVAYLHCTFADQLFCGRVMVWVTMRRTKQELGQDESDEHGSYRQNWRYEPFLMECAAAPMWNLLERSIDFDKMTQRIAEEVMVK